MTAETISKRKPYNHLAGYIASLKNRLTGGHVVIYDAKPAGFDVTAGRYVASCEAHNLTGQYSNLPAARTAMKTPDAFCQDCRAILELPAAELIDKPDDYEEDYPPCRICNAPINSAELCEKCAVGNDPFISSKYNERR